MKKVITMIVIMLVMSMMIPNCALAQSYEEAGENSSIIEELMDLDFAYDTDTGLWIFNATDEYDWGEKDIVSANYNITTNSGSMIYQEFSKDEDGAEYELIVTYNIEFKWYAEEEDFGIVRCVIDASKFINDISF